MSPLPERRRPARPIGKYAQARLKTVPPPKAKPEPPPEEESTVKKTVKKVAEKVKKATK